MLFDTVDGTSQLKSSADLSSRIGIRVRGAFSSSFAEPGYSVETWSDGANVDQDISPLGIAADSDWVLYAPNPQHDETLIDNSFMFDISNQMGHWAPEVRYVEAFVNTDGGDVTMDDYVGMYVITEKVKRTPDRLSFDRLSADGTSGGWILDINRLDPIALDGTPPRNFHTAGPDGIRQTDPDLRRGSSRGDDIPRQGNAYINFDDPNGYKITTPQRESIEGWIQQMEDVLYGRVEGVDWNDPENGYARYIDVDNFIDYFILNDISHNGDGLLLSMWVYNPDPNGDGKLAFGPIWDVDLGSFTGQPQAELMRRMSQLWYGRLFDDPNFVQRYSDRWQQWRETVLSAENMRTTIDRFLESIGTTAAERDGVVNWPERLDAMKDWVAARGLAIDALFVPSPQFNQTGGAVASGFVVTVKSERGDVYFTTDGSDPRLPGGAVSPTASKVQVDFSPLVSAPAEATIIVPDEATGVAIGDTWMGNTFVEGAAGESWLATTTGVGFDRGSAYDDVIGTDLGEVATSVYARVPFELQADDLAVLDSLRLSMEYDDGFVAYINGQEIARANAPGTIGASVPYNETATRSHRARLGEPEVFDVTQAVEFLTVGFNVLAVHGLNVRTSSSDLLIRPELLKGTITSPPTVISEPTKIVARTLDGDEWSPAIEAVFSIGLPGDLNEDGRVTASDIDHLCAAFGDQNSELDLTSDGIVDLDDLSRLVRELIGTSIGDADLDGRFGTSDLVKVFAGGEFEDATNGNSTWADGDWNCDHDFGTGDLVFALQSGGFNNVAAHEVDQRLIAAALNGEADDRVTLRGRSRGAAI